MPTNNTVTDGQNASFSFIYPSGAGRAVENIVASGSNTIFISSNPDERRGQTGADVNLALAPGDRTSFTYRVLDRNNLTVTGDATTALDLASAGGSVTLSTSGVGFPTATINAPVTGSAEVDIGVGSHAEFGRSVASTISVSIGYGDTRNFGPATLEIGSPADFKASVTLNNGQILFDGLAGATDYSYNGTVLTVFGGPGDAPLAALYVSDPDGGGLALRVDAAGTVQVLEQELFFNPIAGSALTQHVDQPPTPVATNPQPPVTPVTPDPTQPTTTTQPTTPATTTQPTTSTTTTDIPPATTTQPTTPSQPTTPATTTQPTTATTTDNLPATTTTTPTQPTTTQPTTPTTTTTQPTTPPVTQPSVNPPVLISDGSTGQPVTTLAAVPYAGPVAGLTQQLVALTAQNLNILATAPNLFIHTGSGTDAIQAASGTNVLDGGTGSNFLTAGTGTDTFFVDARGATTDTWSTVVKFHSGDAATLWGVSAATPAQWVDGQGAAGATGLTLHAGAAGGPTASITLAGFSTADLASGKVTASFGRDAASGSDYLYLHAA